MPRLFTWAVLLLALVARAVVAGWCDYNPPDINLSHCPCGYYSISTNYGNNQPYSWLGFCTSDTPINVCIPTQNILYNTCGTYWSGSPDCCLRNCSLATWSSWSSCSQSCGTGLQQRVQLLSIPGAHNGTTNCPSINTETQSCNTQCCPCEYTWSSWSTCDCGSGLQTRSAVVTNNPTCACPTDQTQSCSATCGPVPCTAATCDCVVSDWSDFTVCNATCGSNGAMTRTRSIVQPAVNGGDPCPSLTETVQCTNNSVCVVDCVVSDWSMWSPCTFTCGGGSQSRSRSISQTPSSNGAACPTVSSLTQTQTCNTSPCVNADCLAPWGSWSVCSATCNGIVFRALDPTGLSTVGNCTEVFQTDSCNLGLPPCGLPPVPGADTATVSVDHTGVIVGVVIAVVVVLVVLILLLRKRNKLEHTLNSRDSVQTLTAFNSLEKEFTSTQQVYVEAGLDTGEVLEEFQQNPVFAVSSTKDMDRFQEEAEGDSQQYIPVYPDASRHSVGSIPNYRSGNPDT